MLTVSEVVNHLKEFGQWIGEPPLREVTICAVVAVVTLAVGVAMFQGTLSFGRTDNTNSAENEDPFPEFSNQGPWWRRLISKFRRPWRTVEMGLGWDRGDDDSIFVGGEIFVDVTAPNGHTSQDEVQVVRLEADGDNSNCTLQGQVLTVVSRWAWSAESETQQSFRTSALDEVGTYFVRYVVFPDGRPDNDIPVIKEGTREAGYTLESLGPVLVRSPELAISKAASLRWAESVEVDVKTLSNHHEDDAVELESLGHSYTETPQRYDGPVGESVSTKKMPFPDKKEQHGQHSFQAKLAFTGKDAPQSPGNYRFLYRSGRSGKVWSASKIFRVHGPSLDAVAPDTGATLTASNPRCDMPECGHGVLSWGAPLTVTCISSQHHGSNDSIILRRGPCLPTRNRNKPLMYPVTPLEWFAGGKNVAGELSEEEENALLQARDTDQEVQLPTGKSHVRFKFGTASKRKEEDGYAVVHKRGGGCRQPGFYYVLYVSSQTRHEESWFGQNPPKKIMGCIGPIVVTGPELYPCGHSMSTVPSTTKSSVDAMVCSYYESIIPQPFSPLMLRHNDESNGLENRHVWWGSDITAFCLWSKFRHSRQDRISLQRIAELPVNEVGSLVGGQRSLDRKETLEYCTAKFLGKTTTAGCDISGLGLRDEAGKLLSQVTPLEKHGALTTVSSVNYASNGFGSSSYDQKVKARVFPHMESASSASISCETSAIVPFHREKAPSLPGVYRFVYELHDPEERWDTMYFGSAPFLVRGPEMSLGETKNEDDDSLDVSEEVDLSTFWGEAVPVGVQASPFRSPSVKDYIALVPVIRSGPESNPYRSVGNVQFSNYGTPINVNDKASSFPVAVSVPDPPGRTDDGASCALQVLQRVFFEGSRAPPRPGLWQLVYYASPTNGFTNIPQKILDGQVLRVRGPSLRLSVVPHTFSPTKSESTWFRWGKSEDEVNDEVARKVVAAYEDSAPIVSVPPKVKVSFNSSPTHNQADWIALCRVDGAPDDAIKNKVFKFVNTSTQGEFCFADSEVPFERGEYQAVYVRGETGPGIWTAIGVKNQDPSSYIHTKHSLDPRDDDSPRQQVASLYDVIARSKETFKIETDPNGRACAIQEPRSHTSVHIDLRGTHCSKDASATSDGASSKGDVLTSSSAGVEVSAGIAKNSTGAEGTASISNVSTCTSQHGSASLRPIPAERVPATGIASENGKDLKQTDIARNRTSSRHNGSKRTNHVGDRTQTSLKATTKGSSSGNAIGGGVEASVNENGTESSSVTNEGTSMKEPATTSIPIQRKPESLLSAIQKQGGKPARNASSNTVSKARGVGDGSGGAKPPGFLSDIMKQGGQPVKARGQSSSKEGKQNEGTRPSRAPSLLDQIQQSGGKPSQLNSRKKRLSGDMSSSQKSSQQKGPPKKGPFQSILERRKHIQPESESEDDSSDNN
eukprot:gb/GECG01004983.1/.p1 GENE.gb/GECG01004983.1/~~gb/GECG01004983.1/.p1  ORF type:complete len:1428 (+),score=184.62 gb/GECG01004983.1/:1-4284(+)